MLLVKTENKTITLADVKDRINKGETPYVIYKGVSTKKYFIIHMKDTNLPSIDIELTGPTNGKCWNPILNKVFETGKETTIYNLESLFTKAEEVHVFFDVKDMYRFILEKLQ
jgi:hypothetical protein